jgi:glycosyltransferase involved in cell wall biosynthesis
MTQPLLSVCISSRDRRADLVRCLNSLRHLDGLEYEVLVVDDGSVDGTMAAARAEVDAEVQRHWAQLIRNEQSAGYLAARNRMPRLARGRYVLSLDDDAYLLDGAGVRRGVEILEADRAIGAVAFAQGDGSGKAYPGFMQPSPRAEECLVPAYYGYAHLLRRDLFLQMGGYPEDFEFFCEEEELCKRMLEQRRFIVYVPSPPVAHETFSAAAGRSGYRRIHNGCRNKCFDAVLNEPWLLLAVSLPVRLYRHVRHVRQLAAQGDWTGGSGWGEAARVVGAVLERFPSLYRRRRPLRWSTFRLWHRHLKRCPSYPDRTVN